MAKKTYKALVLNLLRKSKTPQGPTTLAKKLAKVCKEKEAWALTLGRANVSNGLNALRKSRLVRRVDRGLYEITKRGLVADE